MNNCPDCNCYIPSRKLCMEELDQLPDFKCGCSCHDNEEFTCVVHHE
jgi:hypothetical protein